MDWGEDGWGHNGQQTDPFIGAPGSRKTLSSVFGNKDLCLYLEGIATYTISSFLLYQIPISCNKVQLNHFKIIKLDFYLDLFQIRALTVENSRPAGGEQLLYLILVFSKLLKFIKRH